MKKKTSIGKSISFQKHEITSDGILSDQSKIDAILNMYTLEDVTDVQTCGLVQRISRFLPYLADLLEPLRKLTRKNVSLKWDAGCELYR